MIQIKEKMNMKRFFEYLITKNKLFISIILISLFVISLSGCGSVNMNQTAIKYDYQNAVYEKNNIVIEYPQIDDASINQLLKDSALSVLNYYDTDNEKEFSELLINISCSVETFNDELLSVVFEGTSQLNKDFDRINRYKYSININMNTGEKLRLSDFVDINEDFVFTFRKSVKEQSNEINQDFFDFQTDEQLLQDLLTSDSLDLNSDVGLQRDVFSYVSNNKISIIYPAPRAIGDYVTVEIQMTVS